MISQFIEFERKVKNLSDNTITAYENDLREFARYISANRIAKRWSEIHARTIERYLMTLHEAGMKPSTIRRKLASIRALYNYFMKQGLQEKNPARYIESPKQPKTLPNTIDTGAIERYIQDETKPMALRTLIAILHETGIRISEATALETNDIDYRNHTMRIYGKGLKQRKVYFGHYTDWLLQAYTQDRKGEIFVGADACQRQIRWEIWKALHQYATNGKASPHTIRHTFATRMLEQGMPIQSLQAILGHEHVETTRNYARLADTSIRRDYENATKGAGA